MQWSGAAPELTQLVRGLGIPVTETLMGLGSFPASDPLCLGMLGMHGSYGTNTAVCNTDCLIAVGARFDDRVTGRIADFAPKAKTIIHIDIDPSSISKNVKVDVPIVGDIKTVLTDMLEVVQGRARVSASAAPSGPNGISRSSSGRARSRSTRTATTQRRDRLAACT